MDRVLGRICTTLGVEPGRAWLMEWTDITRLYRYWLASPPVHELVASYLGYKAPAREVSRDARPDIGMTGDEIRAGFLAGSQVPIGIAP